MRKVVVSEFVSLDGVMEAPDKWHFPYWSDEMGQEIEAAMGQADAMTYQGFATAWPSMTDEAGFADRMNILPKFVVSTTLEEPLEWNNSTLIKENVAEEVSRLKQQPGRDILIHGSADLVHTLMQHDLIDEYRIMVNPVVVGSG